MGGFWFYTRGDTSFSPEMCSNVLRLLMHCCSCSALLACPSTQRSCQAEPAVGTCSKGSCPSLFPRSRVGLHMKTNSQFALSSPFSPAVPEPC